MRANRLQAENRKRTKKIKEKRKKKRPPKPLPLIIIPTLFHNNLPIVDLSLYASIVARNCRQWVHAVVMMKNITPQQNFTVIYAYSNTSDNQKGKKNRITNLVSLGEMCDVSCQYTILITLAKIEGAIPEEIKTIKDNPPEPLKLDWDAELIINLLDPEQFHEHYQELALTRKEQEQRIAMSDFIYNLPPRMIYTIPEEKEPISSCASESELPINCDSNFDKDDDNNGSSSIQNGNNNDNDFNSDTNSDLNYEQYIALPDFSKEQELK
ncbi:hypothetical protein G9A89_011038 [Geosiphon pyriformis]|nr:hypothetical protein G9A89_011038 [Geosiphon pyriformis]